MAEVVEIAGTRYELTPMPPVVGRKGMFKLTKLLGTIVGTTASSTTSVLERNANRKITPDEVMLLSMLASFGSAFQTCIANISEEDLDFFREECLGNGRTKVWSDKLSTFIPLAESVFVQNYGLELKLLYAHLRMNYSSFLSDMGSISATENGLVKLLLDKARQSILKSTGSSTESQPADTTTAA